MATAKTTAKKAPAKAKPAAAASTTPKEAAKRAPKIAKEDQTSFAVFATGGKQYRVSPGDRVKIEKILTETTSGKEDYKEGDKIVFDQVLLVDNGATEATIGTPFIPGAAVNATLTKISRYKTVDVIKYKQKSRYFKKYGHRQPYFEVTIDSIK